MTVDYNLNKRDRYMAKKKRKRKKRRPNYMKLAAIYCVFLAVVMFAVAVVMIVRNASSPSQAIASAATATATAFYPLTNTPKPAEPTSVPPTKRPSLTPTELARPEVVYVTEIVMIPADTLAPAPSYTPYPTYTPHPTSGQHVTETIIALQLQYDTIELNKARRSDIWAWVLTIGGIGAGLFFIVMLTISVIRSSWVHWRDSKLDKASGETTRDKIETEQREQIPINDMRRDAFRKARIREMLARGVTSQAEIERELFGYTGGDAYYEVGRLMDEIENETTPLPHSTTDQNATTQA